MYSINPLSGNLAQSAQIQRQQSTDKTKQARKTQDLARSVVTRDDEIEHQVENSEELTPLHEEGRQSDKRRKQQRGKHGQEEEGDDPPERLDLTA